jgi:hypothetical protein
MMEIRSWSLAVASATELRYTDATRISLARQQGLSFPINLAFLHTIHTRRKYNTLATTSHPGGILIARKRESLAVLRTGAAALRN